MTVDTGGSMSAVLQRMSVEEFLAWSEGQEGRYELEDGAVVAMAPELGRHIRTKGSAFVAIRSAIEAATLPCEAYGDGFGVPAEGTSVFIPDVLVQCGEQPADDARIAERPLIVVEILSSSTLARDIGVKLGAYFRLPSLHHYLILDPNKRLVVHHRRSGNAVETAVVRSGELRLDPPRMILRLEDLFPPVVPKAEANA
jgi:Uma2 family endonuclease